MQATPDIDTPYELTDQQIARFRQDGFIKLKNVLSPEALAYFGEEITAKVRDLNREETPLEERGTYGKAFLQVMNIWRHSVVVEAFVRSRRLARIATELLGTKGVRMYHDQALYKEAGGGYTPWHVDQYYWPLSNQNTVTAWIPLDAVPRENGPLEFSKGSQKILFGREFAISDESEAEIEKNLRRSNLPVISEPFGLGEVSFHYGYTFHRAGPNTSAQPRRVMTIIYMDSEMRLIEPKNKSQQADWDAWCPGARVGEVIDTELNPVLYRGKGSVDYSLLKRTP
jgi:ectoine hydroxylase-related dioxygenase (phytanoyl-CoA dioxygenase family)